MKDFLNSYLVGTIAVALVTVTAVLQTRQYLAFTRMVKAHAADSGEEIKRTERPKYIGVVLAVLSVISAGIVVLSILRPDLSERPGNDLVLGLALLVTFGATFFTSDMSNRVYYTDTGFFLKDRFVPYAELRQLSYAPKGGKVELKDSSEYQISRQQIRAMEQLRAQKVFRISGGGKKKKK